MKRKAIIMSISLIAILCIIVGSLFMFLNGLKSSDRRFYMINTDGNIITSKGFYAFGYDEPNENGLVSIVYQNRWPKDSPNYKEYNGIINTKGDFIYELQPIKRNKEGIIIKDAFCTGEGLETKLFLDEDCVSFIVPEGIHVIADYVINGNFPFYTKDPFGKKKYGIMNIDGRVITEPLYEQIDEFSDDEIAAFCDANGLWGYIDINGKIIVEPQYTKVGCFSEGLAAFCDKNDLWGFLDTSGKVVIEPRYDYAGEFTDGLAATDKGYIDHNGNVVIDEFKAEWGFDEGFTQVLGDNGKYGYIDTNGKLITDFIYSSNYHPFENGYCLVEGTGEFEGLYGYIDSSGKQIIDMKFKHAGNFSKEGYAPVETEDGLWGYIKPDGTWYIEPTYSFASEFKNGVAVVGLEKK